MGEDGNGDTRVQGSRPGGLSGEAITRRKGSRISVVGKKGCKTGKAEQWRGEISSKSDTRQTSTRTDGKAAMGTTSDPIQTIEGPKSREGGGNFIEQLWEIPEKVPPTRVREKREATVWNKRDREGLTQIRRVICQ